MYQRMIREELARKGYVGQYDPRHIEAYMRIEHPTLDGLSKASFRKEIEWSRQAVDLDPAAAERCAQSFAL